MDSLRSIATRILTLAGLTLGLASPQVMAGGPHPSIPPPVIPDCLGVNIHFTDPKPGEMEMLAGAGFKWVRMDFSWGATERKRGEYDFSAYDRLVTALEKHGIRALFILDYGNDLYDRGLPPTSDEGRAAFTRWAVAGVGHFAGKGYLWEMWNEPNGGFWKPKADAKHYAALARATGEALRDAKLLGPKGEAYIGPATSTIDLPFLEACFQAGLLEFWDAVSVHPYRQSAPETVESEYRSLRLLIGRYAPKDKAIPIISGEWGYSDAWQNFTPELQGKYLPRQLLTNIANDVPLSIWYDWHDDGTNLKDPEHHFGIVANQYHAGRDPVFDSKPAYVAMKTLTAQLGGFRFNKTIIPASQPRTNGDLTKLLIFQKTAEVRVAGWQTAKAPVALEIPVNTRAFTAFNSFGKAEQLSAPEKGPLRFSADDTPTYLIPQDLDDCLGIIAATPRLPLEIAGRAPMHFEMQGNKFDFFGRSPRPDPIDTTLSVDLPGAFSFSFTDRTYFVCGNPLEVETYPDTQGHLICRIRNPSGDPFIGDVLLIHGGDEAHSLAASEPLRIESGEKEKIVKLAGARIEDLPLKLVIASPDCSKEAYHTCLEIPLGVIRPMETGVLESLVVRGDGDSKVASEQSLASAQPPEGASPAGGGSFQLHYKTAAGWKFFETSSPHRMIPPIHEGASLDDSASFPSRFSIWIYGDARGCLLRTRFKDKTGQVFQPSGPKIDWKGWRYVTLPLKPDEKEPFAHWGGANDGIIHYPIQWDALLLLDNVSREPLEGDVYLSSPTLNY